MPKSRQTSSPTQRNRQKARLVAPQSNPFRGRKFLGSGAVDAPFRLDRTQSEAPGRFGGQKNAHGRRRWWPTVGMGAGARGRSGTAGASTHCAVAAFSIWLATAWACETITTCEAPFTTTVARDLARSAMNAWAAGGMFLSASP